MKARNLLVSSLVFLFLSTLILGVFAGDNGYYCDPKTKVCYPNKDGSQKSGWTNVTDKESEHNSKHGHKYSTAYKFFAPEHTGWMEHIKLTENQKKSVQALLKEYAGELDNEKDKKLELESQINDLVMVQKPDFKTIELKIQELVNVKLNLEKTHLKYFEKIYNVLDSDQQKWVINHLRAKFASVISCPIDGNSIKDIKNAPTSSYKGKTYYFCCPGCKSKFDKDPAKNTK